MSKEKLLEFLQNQKLLTLATSDEQGNPWISNVYFGIDKDFNLYFVSSKDATHSKHIENNSKIAFTTAWFNKNNLGDRKAVQGKGVCTVIKGWGKVLTSLKFLYKKFPDWRKTITVEKLKKEFLESRVYQINVNYMKLWDDELYGSEGTEEFNFD